MEPDIAQMLAECKAQPTAFEPWELEFLDAISELYKEIGDLTTNQYEKLVQMWLRLAD